jgi:hypothetical protein
MDKPKLDRSPQGREDFYAFIGRVSLQLVDNNVDAITVTNFLREIIEAGVHTLTMEQVLNMAQNYVDIVDAPPRLSS